MLKTRGQPGMTSLWARVLGRVAGLPRLFPAAEVCRSVEGDVGYGQALARCAQHFAAEENGRNLIFLVVLQPPGEPADAVETLCRIRYGQQGEAGLLEQVMAAAEDFRGLYATPDLFAARGGRQLPHAKDPEGAKDLRLALALQMVGECTAQDLEQSALPPAGEMSPLVLSCWLRMLARSGLHAQLKGTLDALLAGAGESTPDPRVRIAAGVWASVAGIDDVIAVFDTLPLAPRLAVLDTLWISPREPAKLHPFLLTLANNPSSALRIAALQHLAQYRSRSTAAKLLESSRKFPDTAHLALEALAPMVDLLDRAALDSLIADFKAGSTHGRALARILGNSKDKLATDALVAAWKTDLAPEDLELAMRVLARDKSTPAGAWCAVREKFTNGATAIGNIVRPMNNLYANHETHLVVLRTLLNSDDAAGFDLLTALAADVGEPVRLPAMMTLAMAGRDKALIEDWLRRMAGEVPDPLGNNIGWAVALSVDPKAQEFRRRALQQGASSEDFRWVVLSYAVERCPEIKPAELFNVLLESVEVARRFTTAWRWSSGDMPASAVRNVVSAVLFGEGMPQDPSLALWVSAAQVDVLKLLYGTATTPTPRDDGQTTATALLGDPERAREIIGNLAPREDGNLWVAQRAAQAWLGMLDEQENRRVVRAFTADAGNVRGALHAARQADAGAAGALRRLLDRLGPEPTRFDRGDTAGIQITDRRGRGVVQFQGVANSALRAGRSTPALPSLIVKRWMKDAPEDWGDWWSCRRALLHWDGKQFAFTELP